VNDHILTIPSGQVPGRPLQKGRSGNPAGRRPGSRNRATERRLQELENTLNARDAASAKSAGLASPYNP
jgi:Family of unknown function (DUF5681)